MDDNRLMSDVSGGSRSAFGVLVQRYDAALVRFAARLLGDRVEAEDAVQDSWVRLWRARERYRECGQFQGYMMRLVRNRCLDTLRSRRPRAEPDCVPDRAADPAASSGHMFFLEAARGAVAGLPEAQRIVFVLSVDEGLTYSEIAEVLHCPRGTVASRKFQAVETLRRKLSGWRDGGE